LVFASCVRGLSILGFRHPIALQVVVLTGKPKSKPPANGGHEEPMVVAARLGRQAEEAASKRNYAKAIAIYEQIRSLGVRYPLLNRRLKELRRVASHTTKEEDTHIGEPALRGRSGTFVSEKRPHASQNLPPLEELARKSLDDVKLPGFVKKRTGSVKQLPTSESELDSRFGQSDTGIDEVLEPTGVDDGFEPEDTLNLTITKELQAHEDDGENTEQRPFEELPFTLHLYAAAKQSLIVGQHLCILHDDKRSLQIYDLFTNEWGQIQTISVDCDAMGFSGSCLLFLHRSRAEVTCWSLPGMTQMGSVRVGREPEALHTVDDGRVLVANTGEGSLSVIFVDEFGGLVETQRVKLGGAPNRIRSVEHAHELVLIIEHANSKMLSVLRTV